MNSIPQPPFSKKLKVQIQLIFPAIFIFYSFATIAFLLYDHEFSFINTNISRLGRPSYSLFGGYLMSAGFVITGSILIPFYNALRVFKNEDVFLNKVIDWVRYLGVLSCIGMIFLGIVNGDYHLAHKVIGVVYFSSDIALMLAGCVIVYRHPKISSVLVIFCIASAFFDAWFLFSNGKLSWTEWCTVSLSFFIGAWVSINSRALFKNA